MTVAAPQTLTLTATTASNTQPRNHQFVLPFALELHPAILSPTLLTCTPSFPPPLSPSCPLSCPSYHVIAACFAACCMGGNPWRRRAWMLPKVNSAYAQLPGDRGREKLNFEECTKNLAETFVVDLEVSRALAAWLVCTSRCARDRTTHPDS